jgi:hypothetical protein
VKTLYDQDYLAAEIKAVDAPYAHASHDGLVAVCRQTLGMDLLAKLASVIFNLYNAVYKPKTYNAPAITLLPSFLICHVHRQSVDAESQPGVRPKREMPWRYLAELLSLFRTEHSSKKAASMDGSSAS